ncbi:polynucleotide adenylyltransferase [Clostridia bacterium]|nr:polynucleotide adenylyltransferase [Clostridia bacterium]
MKKYEAVIQVGGKLREQGYKPYLVGGCVRDLLLGKLPHDFDIAADAPPDAVLAMFGGYTLVTAGIKHGTVTVMIPDGDSKVPVEITTFRVDGEYSDCRRPDAVTFSTSVEDDLARRDFTINAMAVSVNENFSDSADEPDIIDPYGGRTDLQNKIVRAVGDPHVRFTEDALRILRGLRFAAVLGFEIEQNTAGAMLTLCDNIRKLSGERVAGEILRMFAVRNGSVLPPLLREFREVFARVFPELRECFGFDQRSRYHSYDVYEHLVRATAACDRALYMIGMIDMTGCAPDCEHLPILRLSMFLHDTGKPRTYAPEGGVGHFPGHPQAGANISKAAAYRLKLSNRDTKLLTDLILLHDTPLTDIAEKPASDVFVKKKMSEWGLTFLQLLAAAHVADALGKQPEDYKDPRIPLYQHFANRAKEIADRGECVTVAELAVTGADIAALGYSGKDIGEALGKLLSAVIEERLVNTKEQLLEYLR